MPNNFNLIPDFNSGIPMSDISLNNKHYSTIQKDIVNLLGDYVKEKKYRYILEVGPLSTPIPYSTHTVNIDIPNSSNNFCIDIDRINIPVPDKFFDFGYARHVFEDIQNPDFAFNELKRTCKEFYIETPSPLVEFLKDVDFYDVNEVDFKYRGYIHHRYFIWSEGNNLYCLPKYPIIEYLSLNKSVENKLIYIANNYPIAWNNYILCNEDTNIIMLKNDMHFNFINNNNSYPNFILTGILQSMENTNLFIPKLLNGTL